MSFSIPTTVSIVDKFPPRSEIQRSSVESTNTVWDTVEKYNSFKELVEKARMVDLLKDPQFKSTIFIPLDVSFPRQNIFSCFGNVDEIVFNVETARSMVESVIVPNILSTTMIMQSCVSRFKTRNPINFLTFKTPHCVLFESTIYNKPPFGIVINGIARISNPDILTSNGMVHITGKFPFKL